MARTRICLFIYLFFFFAINIGKYASTTNFWPTVVIPTNVFETCSVQYGDSVHYGLQLA